MLMNKYIQVSLRSCGFHYFVIPMFFINCFTYKQTCEVLNAAWIQTILPVIFPSNHTSDVKVVPYCHFSSTSVSLLFSLPLSLQETEPSLRPSSHLMLRAHRTHWPLLSLFPCCSCFKTSNPFITCHIWRGLDILPLKTHFLLFLSLRGLSTGSPTDITFISSSCTRFAQSPSLSLTSSSIVATAHYVRIISSDFPRPSLSLSF